MGIEAFTSFFSSISNVRIRSITDPLFRWGSVFMGIGILTSYLKMPLWLTFIPIFFCILMILIGIIFYIYYGIKNPDYLRSESYQLRKQSIQMLGDKDKVLSDNTSKLILLTAQEAGENPKKDNNGE